MSFAMFSRRSFFSSLAGLGVSLPFLTRAQTGPNRPLVVTSKTNPAVCESITGLEIRVMPLWGMAAIPMRMDFTSSTLR